MPKEEKLEGQDKDIDLKGYADESGVSLKRMNFGLWLAEHRRQITKTIIIALILVSAFFFIYSSYNYFAYFLAGDPNAQAPTNNLIFTSRTITEELETSPLQVFDNDGRYDLVAQISNPNDKFMASFNYCFKQGETNISCGQSFILPGEKKYVLALAQQFSGSRSELSFAIADIFWRRIDTHQIPDWSSFYAKHLDFAISDLKFTAAAVSGLSEKVNLNTVDFSLKNQTAYGYYEAPLNIFLYSGSEIIAVNRYILNNFLAGETRTVSISWPGHFNSVTRTEVVPDINIMDDGAYLKYQGSSAN